MIPLLIGSWFGSNKANIQCGRLEMVVDIVWYGYGYGYGRLCYGMASTM